jgi:hypothetical protein
MRVVTHNKLCDAMGDLLGADVELHHSTMHVKPPETGHPFPMHQDWAFYQHLDNRYVDVLVHTKQVRSNTLRNKRTVRVVLPICLRTSTA